MSEHTNKRISIHTQEDVLKHMLDLGCEVSSSPAPTPPSSWGKSRLSSGETSRMDVQPDGEGENEEGPMHMIGSLTWMRDPVEMEGSSSHSLDAQYPGGVTNSCKEHGEKDGKRQICALVVDDHKGNQLLVGKMLCKRGYRCGNHAHA